MSKRPQTVGEHLRKKRFESGLRQFEVARKLGISERTLGLWECDEVYLRWEYHPVLIEYLGYDPFPSCGLRTLIATKPRALPLYHSKRLLDASEYAVWN